jgi:FAD synthase
MELFQLFIVIAIICSATYIMSIILIGYTFEMLQRIYFLENTLPTHINTLSKKNRNLSKHVEKLIEYKARNEMEQEDDKSFINKLYCQVQTNNKNIATLFVMDKLNNRHIAKLYLNELTKIV